MLKIIAVITAACATALPTTGPDRIDGAGREPKSSRSILLFLPIVHAEDWHGARRGVGAVTVVVVETIKAAVSPETILVKTDDTPFSEPGY